MSQLFLTQFEDVVKKSLIYGPESQGTKHGETCAVGWHGGTSPE